jgi:hypothetical protein
MAEAISLRCDPIRAVDETRTWRCTARQAEPALQAERSRFVQHTSQGTRVPAIAAQLFGCGRTVRNG